MKKILLMAIIVLFIAGCGNSRELEKNYENMKIAKDNINGYVLDLRIRGVYKESRINETIRITNYNNKDYKIERRNTSAEKKVLFGILGIETIYIVNGKTYIEDEEGKYVEGEYKLYNTPSIYLEGLKNLKSVEEPSTEKIGNNKYKKYKVVFKKDIIKEIIKDTTIKEKKINDDVEGEVYINSEGYVYQIIYDLEEVTINANYFNINNVKPISVPSNNNTKE